ncbi:hypothetical protein BDW67DRAFT_176122 [Aspergillus spinulosporus]
MGGYRYTQSLNRAKILKALPGLSNNKNKIILLHFTSHNQNIKWFWAAVLAGYLPALSPLFTNNEKQHIKHLAHLKLLLDNLVVLISASLAESFGSKHGLNMHHLKSFTSAFPSESRDKIETASAIPKRDPDIAVLMLTSGSTGNAKVVILKHAQIINTITSKSNALKTCSTDIFLNYIRMDHVASLVKSHLHALYLSASQVHISASKVVAKPLKFVRALSKFKVSVLFAPNFFLAKLEQALTSSSFKNNAKENLKEDEIDLSNLRVVTSGGKANSISTTIKLLNALERYNAPRKLIYPGFGITETCAGCIYSMWFPKHKIKRNLQFALLGRCTPGVRMQVKLGTDPGAGAGTRLGMLQVSGPLVFNTYINNSVATASTFTDNRWFITGNLALINKEGMLYLAGRIKDTLNVNGVKYNLEDIKGAIKEAKVAGIISSYTKVFAVKPEDAQTEGLVITYLAEYEVDNNKARVRAQKAIACIARLQCSTEPLNILPLITNLLQKSSLGKLSRANIQSCYLNSKYALLQSQNSITLSRHKQATFRAPLTPLEKKIQFVLADLIDLTPNSISATSGLMEIEVSSIKVLKFKALLQEAFVTADIPIITILTSTTIDSLAVAVKGLLKPRPYNPVIVLNNQGTKLLLWLVYPGAGKILVYLNLATQITDQLLYVLCARGFNNNKTYFENIPELINTYYTNIKKVQPVGPYAILGYLFRSMFAAELLKKLIGAGDKVKFTGVLNLPPHVQYCIRQLNMVTAILTLALFLNFIQDNDPDTFHPDIDSISYGKLLDKVLRRAPEGKLGEVGLNQDKFMQWAEVSNLLHMIAWDYVLQGKLPSVDVWVAHPLEAVARNKEEWFGLQMVKWNNFCKSAPRFYDTAGEHFMIINKENTPGFARQLRAALDTQGF